MLSAAVIALRGVFAALGLQRRVHTVIYKVDRLGDWLLAEPAIRCLIADTQTKKGLAVTWAATETAALRAWRPIPGIVHAFSCSPKGFGGQISRAITLVFLLARYRARRFVSLRYAPDAVRDFMFLRAAAEERIGFSAIPRLMGELHGEPDIPEEFIRHTLLLRAAGLTALTARDLLSAIPRPQPREAPPTLLIAPFGTSTIRDWPIASWTQVASKLGRDFRRIEIWVAQNQVLRANHLAGKLRQACSQLEIEVQSGTLAELAQAVGSAKLVIAVETFAAHLAVAIDAKMIGIIGGGHYAEFAPWRRSNRQRWVVHMLPCFSCQWRCIRPTVECLQALSPGKVLEAVHSIEIADRECQGRNVRP